MDAGGQALRAALQAHDPGVQRVRRYYDGFGGPVCDMMRRGPSGGEGAARGNTLVAVNDAALVTDVSELEYRELLVPIVRDGSAVAPRESIQDARERCVWALDHLDAAFKRFLYPQTYVVGMEQGLAQVRDELVRKNMAAASAFPGQNDSLGGRGESRSLGRQLGRSLNS